MSRERIRGQVYKRIEEFRFYHSKSEHAKDITVEFFTNQFQLNQPKNGKNSKTYELNEIISVQQSDLKPVSCDYLFPFVLQLGKRKLTLFCSTEMERKCWVRIFETVAVMNKLNLNAYACHPLDVLSLALEITKKSNQKKTVTKSGQRQAHSSIESKIDIRNCNAKEIHINMPMQLPSEHS